MKLAALLLMFAFIAGCGQKGPLFLPGDPSTIQTDVPAQTDTPPDDEADDDEDEQ